MLFSPESLFMTCPKASQCRIPWQPPRQAGSFLLWVDRLWSSRSRATSNLAWPSATAARDRMPRCSAAPEHVVYCAEPIFVLPPTGYLSCCLLAERFVCRSWSRISYRISNWEGESLERATLRGRAPFVTPEIRAAHLQGRSPTSGRGKK